MRVRLLAATCLVIAMVAPSCGRGSSGPPAVPGGGEIAGLLVTQRSDGSHRVVDAGARIGLYTKAFPAGGPILRSQPRPVVATVTSSDGSFEFHDLAPGRYWVTLVGQGHAVTGRWASVTAERGASVLLVTCIDCPVPL
jgi:hypothetical protein